MKPQTTAKIVLLPTDAELVAAMAATRQTIIENGLQPRDLDWACRELGYKIFYPAWVRFRIEGQGISRHKCGNIQRVVARALEMRAQGTDLSATAHAAA